MPLTEFWKLLASFGLGSIPFAVLAMTGTGVDIRRQGSLNPGFNNVLRFSRWRAAVTLAGDLAKGFAAVWLFYRPADPMLWGWLLGFAAVLGHCYSPFLRFQGGKGIATSAGVGLVLHPALAVASLAVYTLARVAGARRKWVEAGTIASLGSIVWFTLLLLVVRGPAEALPAAVLTVFVAWRHKRNFQILAGTLQPQP
ncbi:MAG: glycerol-3-phosphate acyltransferase [Acidobacteria bacterium]|nr:glycerol-3-phosphate acyltransferase [Acidobacteriota bacterium]